MFQAVRKRPYRDLEDQVRNYAPARYLCGLTETDWSPDFTTVHDFQVLLGEDGMREINEHMVKLGVTEGFADPSVLVADITAQEAAIPHPNEMGLMATFMTALACAGTRGGAALKTMAEKLGPMMQTAKEKLRAHRLFAKTKEARQKLLSGMATLVEKTQAVVARSLRVAKVLEHRLRGRSRRALAKVEQLHQTMTTLLPQIRYWMKTGFVAANKIINVHIPELYSVVRGKAGKSVEFGLAWGFARLRGGFVLATLGRNRRDMVDARFAIKAVEDHIALFGKAPTSYGYDRGGYSADNVARLKAKGVKDVGLAPRGKTPWAVKDDVRKRIVKERTLVEGSIGTAKSAKFGFNKPAARSVGMMGVCGQRAVLGMNITQLIRGWQRQEAAAAG